jgi:hypothetical protein
MKKALHLLFTLMMALSLTTQLTSCKETQLEVGVAYLNSQCPIDCGSGLDISSVTLQDDCVLLSCEVSRGLTSIINIKDFDNPIVKEVLLNAVSPELHKSSELEYFIEALKETETDIVFKFQSKDSDESTEIVIQSHEIK